MHPNPYAEDLGDREPLQALEETPRRIRALLDPWTTEQFERTYAPGKWTARKILIHLAQTELALGTRIRFALAQDNYAAQSFAQDYWLPLDEAADARTALDAYTSLRRLNVALWGKLTDAQKARTFSHPEYGQLTVGWIARQMAGHDLHHLKHFERIAAGGTP